MDRDTDSKDFATSNGHEHIFSNSNNSSPQNSARPHADYLRLVIPDPAAFRYLEEDSSTTVLERRRRLKGYELYFVEQWGCSRVHPTYTITTYTGLEHHSIVVGVLSLPTDESAWSPRLRVYLKAITKYHARRRETPLGTLMVTNLSAFPSVLTVIPVPEGDLRKSREAFITNEDLKRLNCSGRAGLNVAPPTVATRTKFYQSYLASDQLPLGAAVVEMVKLCQVALMYFDKLPPEYCDGLLCDVTERAVTEWWSDIGSDIFNIDPSDGILGPSTVAALLGLLMGARNRLSASGAPVSKDVFDLSTTKRAIAHFQKSQKMDRTRRLDKHTLNRLHKVTARAASGEGWGVPRAVKSTVAELKGKGGELVNGREKAGIADVESVDIETFVQLGSGTRFKWLWHGKPRKNFAESEVFGSIVGEEGWVFDDNEQGGYQWSNKRRDSADDESSVKRNLSDHFYTSHHHGSQMSVDHMEKDPVLRKAVLKNAGGRASDGRRGLGRIKSAVGLRNIRGNPHGRMPISNAPVPDRDDMETPGRESNEFRHGFEFPQDKSPNQSQAASTAGSTDALNRMATLTDESNETSNRTSADFLETPSIDNMASNEPRSDYLELIDSATGINARAREHEDMEQVQHRSRLINDTAAIKKMEHFDWARSQLPPLRSTRSLTYLSEGNSNVFWEQRWPRRMSFTAMLDVLAAAPFDSISTADRDLTSADPDAALAFEQSFATQNRVMEFRLQRLKLLEIPWIESKIAQIEAYDQQCIRDQAKLDLVYHHKTEENHALRDASEDLVAQEKAALSEASKDLETVGARLEYELNTLQGKVEDVEDGVAELEKQVEIVEARVREQLLSGRESLGSRRGDNENKDKVKKGWLFGWF